MCSKTTHQNKTGELKVKGGKPSARLSKFRGFCWSLARRPCLFLLFLRSVNRLDNLVKTSEKASEMFDAAGIPIPGITSPITGPGTKQSASSLFWPHHLHAAVIMESLPLKSKPCANAAPPHLDRLQANFQPPLNRRFDTHRRGRGF